ncbi:Uncharacterised protein [Candidatus Gugararchaeum adminiculabundum]|nr:Uncharacterised protein [Candidatus Gugararchaeum adminiculabundum]
MASDASKAAVGIARVVVSLAVGGVIGWMLWEYTTWMPDWQVYICAALSALMTGILISKQSKGT